jgi:hypothetical protein
MTTYRRRSRLGGAALGAGCLVAGLVAGLAAQPPAAAAPGAGTWTRITSPANGRIVLSRSGHEGTWTIKGKVSSDVAEVNVYCVAGSGATFGATTVATGVSVSSSHTFATTVPVPGSVSSPQCRLRALPFGVNPQTAYLASYAGPVVNLDSWQSAATEYQILASAGSGVVQASSAGSCPIAGTAPTSDDQSAPGGAVACLLGLDTNGAQTASAVRIDGHDAYLPAAATRRGLTSSRAISLHVSIKNGGVRWTDVEPLGRCPGQVGFPPPGGCVLQPTGVELHQVVTLLASGSQVRVRTGFRSTDGRRHTLRLAYLDTVTPTTPGDLGVRFPGGHTFRAPSAGLSSRPRAHRTGTMLLRTDRFGDEGDPELSTLGLSWSRAPSRISFVDDREFELDYALTVPRSGSVRLGFASSVGVLTSATRELATRAERDMMPTPRIHAPKAGSVVKGTKTKVSGVVLAGANGLPVSVRVNGHRARLKVNKAGTRARFTVTFTESLGRHKLTAVAKDAAGLRRSASVRVRNKGL